MVVNVRAHKKASTEPSYLDWEFMHHGQDQIIRVFFIWMLSIWQRFSKLSEKQRFIFWSHD
jgi:hypothetical protein